MRIIVWFSLFTVLAAWPQTPSQAPVTIDGLEFRVVAVVFDETALGFVPADMDSDSHVLLVELELLSGSRDVFKDLEIQVACDQGNPTGAIIQIAEGMVKMLSTVTMSGSSSEYRPGTDNVTWAFVVPFDASGLLLQFASGEALTLFPYIK